MRRKRLKLTALALLICCGLSATTWYVNGTAGGGGDGRSWGSAFKSVQKALDAAVSGDRIWIAGGVYHPENVREIEGENAYASSFELKDGVSLYGGFAGTETALAQRSYAEDALYAWEFANPTVLAQYDGVIGGVLKTGAEPLSAGNELDGLVVENGNALGSGSDGDGGGLQGAGRITVRNCLFRGNRARNGGGIYWNGAITMESTGLFDNELVEEGWSGYGGGAAVIGDGFSLTGVIACGNGCTMRGVQSGGGLYLSGNGLAAHCTVVGNLARRNASGVWLDSAACLLNSIVWGNTGAQTQLVADDGEVRCSAVESTLAEGVGNFPLLSQNAGPNGVDANDNWVDGYYPCFVNPAERDFRLGAGSYAINRGEGQGSGVDACGQPMALYYPADLGACGSTLKGNLAVDFSAEYPYLYGGESSLLVYLGLSSPSMVNSVLSADSQRASLTEVELHVWKAEWLKKGSVAITLTVEARGSEQTFWNVATVTRSLNVMPRPLVLAADDLDYHFNSGEPELTWFIAAGRLIGDDSITGSLQCDLTAGQIGEHLPITRGTLTVDDGNNGENYALSFQDGELAFLKGETQIQLAAGEVEYDGTPQTPEIVTEPEGLDVTVTYTGINGTDYGPTDVPPTDAGEYEIQITVDDEQYGGETTLPFTIQRAPLEAIADNQARMYLQPNPPLTISYNGFKGADTAADITVPTATTEATQTSPVTPDGYPIVLAGGSARNYELTLVNGLLTVTKAEPVIDAAPTISAIMYGDALAAAVITPAGGTTPGTYSWDAPETIPNAGEATYAWSFVPEDGENYTTATGTSAISVAKRPVTVTAGTYSRQYGDDDPEFAATLADGSLPLVGNDSITATYQRNGGDAVGTYDVMMQTVSISDNYAITSLPGRLTITPRAVTITANSLSKLLGQEDPELTWRITAGSLVHDDVVSGSLVRESGQTPGTYAIRQGTLALSDNYALTFQEGLFTISQIVLSADDAVVSAGTITYGQHLADATIEGTVVHPATGEEIPGTFAWDNPSLEPGAGVTDCRWTFTPDPQTGLNSFSGTTPVVIAKALLDVALADDSPTRQYFCANPEFTLVYSGFVGNDSAASLRLPPTATTTAVLTSVPGEYPVTIGGGLDDNYSFRATGGTLTVTAATPVQLGDVSATAIEYGQTFNDSILTGYFVQPESLAQIPGKLEWKTQDSSAPVCGNYTREWTFTPASPYFNSVSGEVTVNVGKATLTITAESFDVMLNAPLPTFTMSFSGLRQGESASDPHVITSLPTITCEATDTREEGTYAIVLTGGSAPNYDIVLVNGTLTVNLPQPYVHNMATVHVVYGEVLGETEVIDRPTLDYDYDCDIPFIYITDTLTMYNKYDGSTTIPSNPGPYKPEYAYFTHPVTGEYITGVMSWEYGDVLLPAGSYDNFIWTFTPYPGQGVSAVSGAANVIVDPRPVRVRGPEVTYNQGDKFQLELLYDWDYERNDVLEEPVCSGMLHINRTSLNNLGAGVTMYLTYGVSLGSNYKAVIDMDGPRVVVLPRVTVLTLQPMFINVGDLEPDQLEYKLSDTSGILTDRIEIEFTRDPGTSPGKYRYYIHHFLYTLAPDNLVLNTSRPAYLYISETYDNVAVDSYDIYYGDALPTPTFTCSAYLDKRDISGAPSIQGTPREPGTYTISKGTLRYTGYWDAPTIFDGVLTIKKRPIVLRTGTLYKQAGEPDPVPTVEIVSGTFLAGDSLPGSVVREAGEASGSYAFVPNEAMLNDPHYEYSFTEDSKLVIVGEDEVQWDSSDLASTSLIYGDLLGASRLSGVMRDASTGNEIPGTWAWVSPDEVVREDGARHQVSFLPDNPLLQETTVSVAVRVKPRHIGIRIHSHTIEWGDELPELTFDIVEGELAADDHFVGQLTAYKVNDLLYYIRLGSLAVSNGIYDIAVVNTADEVPAVYVTKRRITVEALNLAKPEGSADPDGLYRITAGTLLDGDSVTDIQFTREAGEEPGDYAIAITGMATALSPDMAMYDVTLVDGTLSVLGEEPGTPSGQRSKIIVNAAWSAGVSVGDTVVWESEEFIYGINAFSELDYAIANADDNGVIFIAPGEYTAQNGVWNIEKSLSLIGDDHGEEEGQIVLLGTMRAVGSDVQKLLLSNIAIASASDALPALELGDGVGASFILDCQLIGGSCAVSIGMHAMGASFIYNDIEATGDCIRCVPAGGQVPTVPLTLVCNSFTGTTAVNAQGFSIIASSNIFNNISAPAIGN